MRTNLAAKPRRIKLEPPSKTVSSPHRAEQGASAAQAVRIQALEFSPVRPFLQTEHRKQPLLHAHAAAAAVPPLLFGAQAQPPPPPHSVCSDPSPPAFALPPPAAPVGLFRFPGAAEADGPMRALAEDPFHFDWPHW